MRTQAQNGEKKCKNYLIFKSIKFKLILYHNF